MAASVAAKSEAVKSAMEERASVSLPCVKLSQFRLQDLAGTRQRQSLRTDLDAARAFEAGDALAAVGDGRFRAERCARLGHQDGVHPLAPDHVGDADHRAF